MDAEERKRIIEASKKRREAAQQNPAVQAPAPQSPVSQPVIRATGGAEIRVIDENNPPTEVRTPFRGGVRAHQGAPIPAGPRVMGARVADPASLQPGPRVQGIRQAGQYGAQVVGGGAPASAQPPAAAGIPGSPIPTAANPNLTAQIQAMGSNPSGPGVRVADVGSAAALDVTVIMSQHMRPETLERQYRALSASGVVDPALWCWVNPSGARLNDRLLGRLCRFGANNDVGPWFRWSLVSMVSTQYVLVIDDDCTPGPQWLRIALDRLRQAESEGERLIIAAAGSSFTEDAYGKIEPIGPESLYRVEINVDLGRGAWLMPIDLARAVLAYPLIGSPLATSIHIAAAVQSEGASTIVLPYPHNQRELWGMLELPNQVGSISQQIDREATQGRGPTAQALRQIDYDVYRSAGWEPLCVLEDSAKEEESST